MRAKKILAVSGIAVGGVVLIAALVLAGFCLFFPRSDPKFIAHRGYSDRYVGNTAESFRAAEMDFYGVETDVRETADGVFVCNHDPSVAFADGSERTISESTYAELAAKPLRNTKTDDDVCICRFEDYLRICSSGGKVAVIELKDAFGPEKITRLLETVDAVYDRKHISVISFDFEALLRVRQADPDVSVQYLSKTGDDPVFDRCLREGVDVNVKQTILTGRLVRAFHEKGLRVNVWTVNKIKDLTAARIKQVDFVTSDLLCRS